MRSSLNTLKQNTPHLIFVALLLLLLGNVWYTLIGHFSEPMLQGDAAAWPYISDYFNRHISLWPWPQLELVHNETFYPEGINHVFQAWCLEREYFYLVLIRLFGPGPWLSLYFFISLAITGIGSYCLLFKPYGAWRSGLAALFLSVGHIYLLSKFPDHLNVAAAHWTILGLILDYLLFKAVLKQQHILLEQIFLRLLLLFLSLGLDLSYVAAYSLSSFLITTVFLAWHQYKHKYTLKTNKPAHLWLYFAAILILSWLYLPLLLQISGSAKSFDFSEVPPSNYWAMPLRFGLSYLLPEAWVGKFSPFLGDNVENDFVLRPGLFLLLLASIAWLKVPKERRYFAPLLSLTLLCLIYHPVLLPSLKIFPWFAFHRVGGRSSIIYPVILVLIALQIPFPKTRSYRLALASILALGAIEMDLAYAKIWSYRIPHRLAQADLDYAQKVKQLPGEALLEWPFCATGGNGVGLETLCPYFSANNALYTYRRLHTKKVMGQYFGRLHPEQLNAYLNTGWDQLFTPSAPGSPGKKRQSRCFNEQEWHFFDAYFQNHDFAGISLLTSLLPSDCTQAFKQRYGPPIARTTHPEAGLILLFPRPVNWPVAKSASEPVLYRPLLPPRYVNFIKETYPEGIQITGLSQEQEQQNHKDAQGKYSRFSFTNQERQERMFRYQLENLSDPQIVSLWLDEQLLKQQHINKGENISQSVLLNLLPGHHHLKLEYSEVYSLKKIILTHLKENPGIHALSPLKLKKHYRKLKNKSVRYFDLSLSEPQKLVR